MLAWSIYFAAITKNVTILTNPKREETEGEGAGEDCVIPNWWRFMFNAKQAIIINYAPGCQSSALAIDIVPHRHTATTTTTKTETEAETTTSAITRETKVYKANTCLAFISFLEWAVAWLRTDATSGERIWLQLYEMRFGKCSKRRTNKKMLPIQSQFAYGSSRLHIRRVGRLICHGNCRSSSGSEWKALKANRIAST